MIETKEKNCKGTGKAKGYGCGVKTKHRIYGLGKMCCYSNWLLNSEQGKIKMQKAAFKVTAPRKSLEKAIKEKKNRDRITAHLKNTKIVVHEYIRKRDKGKPCISCNTPYKKDFDAGHCFGANNYRSIKFYFMNIFGQCIQCNRMKDGNHDIYILNLPNRIGQKEYNKLIDLAKRDKQFNKHWTKEELKQIRIEAKKLIKQLEKNE